MICRTMDLCQQNEVWAILRNQFAVRLRRKNKSGHIERGERYEKNRFPGRNIRFFEDTRK